MSKLAENLQEKISKSGLSQRKIAKMAGIPESTLRNILADKVDQPRIKTLEAICDVLEIKLQSLLISNLKEVTENNSKPLDVDLFLKITNKVGEFCLNKQRIIKEDEFISIISKIYDLLSSKGGNVVGLTLDLIDVMIRESKATK